MGKNSKKSLKKRWKSLPSVVRTCLVGMILFLVAGAGLQIYGFLFANISESDVKKATAEIVSIEKRLRNLNNDVAEELRQKGYDEEYIKYEYEIEYRYAVDGTGYSYKSKELLDRFSGKVGDKKELRYVIKNGKPIINPNSDFVYTFCGVVLVIIGVAAGAAAYVLGNKKKKS